MEHESHHHHHPHGTGFRWLDIHSAHSMEKLVAANSYPYLEQWRNMGTGKLLPGTDRGQRRVEYEFGNHGVGPARIEWVQLFFKDKPMADISDLLEACCSGSKETSNGLDRRGHVVGKLVRPGATLAMFTWDEQSTPNPVFDALHRQMNGIQIDYCYCSVFDECYLRHHDDRKPISVKSCEAPAKTFHPGYRDD